MTRWYSQLLIIACLRLVWCAQVTDYYSDTPDSGFIRRAFHSSALLNQNTLIVDGGEIAQQIASSSGGKEVPTNLPSTSNANIYMGFPNTFPGTIHLIDASNLSVNFTLSIDLSKSWNPSNVPWTSISKAGSYPLNNQILWPAKDGITCYGFGGETSTLWINNNLNPTYSPRPVDLYQFTLNSQLSGNWTTFNAPSYRSAGQNSIFQTLNRPSHALGAMVDNTGFIVDGVENALSQVGLGSLNDPVSIPGIASYNISTSQWSNDTIPDSATNTFLIGVPSFGPSGLLISSGSSGIGASSQTLNNLTVYEPIGKTWHVQKTTGGPPLIRNQPCTVGVEGSNRTFEIFLYAGEIVVNDGQKINSQQETSNKALDEVWVLSLPAFAWFKANYTPQATRFRHTCHVVGNRQMLSIGGNDPNDGASGILSNDTARQGIQIFDLTEMVWTQGYNASDAPYESPQVVKDWYSKNNVPQFDDPALNGFFKSSATTSGSPSSSSTPTPAAHSSNTGAIAGGVVGGIVGLAIILGLLWFFLRRRKNKQHQRHPQEEQPQGYYSQEGQPKWTGASEPVGVDAKSELDAKQRTSELQGKQEGMDAPEMEAISRPPDRGPFEIGDRR